MNSLKDNIYACIEVGSFEIKLGVYNIREERFYVLSQKEVPSVGIEAGKITNFDQLVTQIKQVKQAVESDLGQPLKQIILCIAPIDVQIEAVIGKINLDVNHPIQTADIRKLFRQVMTNSHDEAYLPIQLVPRLFRIDESNVVQNPHNITGMKLGFEGQRILSPITVASNLVHAVESAGFKISDVTVGSIAETLMAIDSPQLFMRMCHINIGHTSSTISIVHEGKVFNTQVLSIGGRDFTQKIMEVFNIEENVADELKINFGRFNSQPNEQTDEQIIYIQDVENETVRMTRKMLDQIMHQQCHHLFKVIKNHLVERLRLKEDEYHFILTGGGAAIPSLIDAATLYLGSQVKIESPTMLGVRHPKYNQVVAMAVFAHELTLLIGAKKTQLQFETSNAVEKTQMKQEAVVEAQNDVHVPYITASDEQLTNVSIPDTINHTMKIYGADDDMTDIEQEELDIKERYSNKKLENSGVLVKLFDMIFNENNDAQGS